jgi:hypothetical protein
VRCRTVPGLRFVGEEGEVDVTIDDVRDGVKDLVDDVPDTAEDIGDNIERRLRR